MDTNPYEVTPGELDIRLTTRQQIVAVTVGGVVTIASAVTMAAFLFGTAGRVRGQIDASTDQPVTRLGWHHGASFWTDCLHDHPDCNRTRDLYHSTNTANAEGDLLETKFRRLDLHRQVEEIRQSLDR